MGPMLLQRNVVWSRVALCVMVTGVMLASCSSSTGTLPLATYHANNSRTGYTTGSSITAANASHLSEKWHLSVTAPISDQSIDSGPDPGYLPESESSFSARPFTRSEGGAGMQIEAPQRRTSHFSQGVHSQAPSSMPG